MRSSPRCIIKGIGIAAALFLGFQLIFMFLMRIPEPTHTKILPRDTQNQPKQYKESEEAECKGWDCLGDREDKEFHPRDIRLPKTKPPGVKDKASDDKLQAARQADLKMIEDLHERVHEDIKKTANTDDKQNQNKADEEKLKDIVLPRGVLRSDGLKYLPNKDGHFVCLFSQDKIPYEQLNDDYCDCSDGTDEPGTSACSPYAKSRFYCTNQEAESAPIFSSRVNDGVCDCCDGSDEFEGKLVTGLAHSEKVHNSPCRDTCKALLDIAQEKELQKLEGKKHKKQYIEMGKLYNKQKQFGEDGEFYTLSESCYYKTVSKYEYTVCPFKDVYQGDDRDSTVIGKTPRWLSHDPGRHVLMMEDGSSINCPNPPRSVKIIFECGLDDEITRVEEAETCRYTVHMLTPAAC